MKRFENKVAIITGSSAGIGQATALLMAKEGALVTIHGQSFEKLETTKSLILQADVPLESVVIVSGLIQDETIQKELIEKTISKFGRLDVLINNVGQSRKSGVDDRLDIEHYDYVMEINLRSVITLTQLAIPYLEKTKGNVVNISSIAALRTSPLTPYYSVAKCALDSWTKNAAAIYGSKGIRVNAINPGTIDTDIWKRSDDSRVIAFRDKLIKETVVDRMGSPDEVARVIAFLASTDEAAFITGSCWLIDGGAMVTPSYFGQK